MSAAGEVALNARVAALRLVDELLGLDAEYAEREDLAGLRADLHAQVRRVIEVHRDANLYVTGRRLVGGLWIDDEKGDG